MWLPRVTPVAIGSRCFLLLTLVVTVDRGSKKFVLLLAAGKESKQEPLEWQGAFRSQKLGRTLKASFGGGDSRLHPLPWRWKKVDRGRRLIVEKG
jgi:hypothetical protein